ncbi:hypothetical protein LXL04_032112 [Taraxacum kok-saghyz]
MNQLIGRPKRQIQLIGGPKRQIQYGGLIIDLNNLFTYSQDRPLWKLEKSGKFTLGSLRRHIDENSLTSEITEWDWHNLLPRKVNILAWRVAHGRLPTNANLVKRGIGTNQICTLCKTEQETEQHLFVECDIAKEVWAGVKLWWHNLPSQPICIGDMTKWRKDSNRDRNGDKNFLQPAVILTFIWVMWSFRNKKAHTNSLDSYKGLANEIQSLSFLWISSLIQKKKIDWTEWCSDPLQVCVWACGLAESGPLLLACLLSVYHVVQ